MAGAALSEPVPERPLQLRIDAHILTHHRRNAFAGQIILCRAESAGKDEQVVALPRLFEHAGETGKVVANRVFKVQIDTKGWKASSDELAVRVDDLAQKDFGAHRDDFCSHACLRAVFTQSKP